ncbi:MAG: TonB family protein, partial [Muribaculaceae bacterium]|nr:TonB family protein [Muribaculaceae bacterium]
LRSVHEYQADAAVLRAGVDARLYQMLLIKKAVGRSFPAIANSLNHSNLKKRITMMLKTKQNKGRRWRALMLAPAAAAVLTVGNIPAVANTMATVSSASLPAFSTGKVTQNRADVQAEKSTQANGSRNVTTTTTYNCKSDDNTSVRSTTTIMVNGDIINIEDKSKFFVNGKEVCAEELRNTDLSKITKITVDQSGDNPSIKIALQEEKADKDKTQVILPQFKGGDAELWKWLAENIKFPDTDAAKKIKDTVCVVVRFTVTAEGKVTDPELLRSSNLSEFNDEALRVVRQMPDFIPAMQDGKPISASYALPINFKAM